MLLLLLSIIAHVAYSIKVKVNGYESNDVISFPEALKMIEQLRENKEDDATVYVDGGNYEPFTLNNKHDNIKFIATRENNTIINGGYHITSNWKNNNGIWTSIIDLPSNYSMDINNSLKFPKQLWINNERRNKSQTNILFYASTLNPTDATANINKYGLIYKKGDIKSNWNLYAPGVIIYVFHQWTVSLHQIKYHNFNNQTIIFQQPSSNPIGQFNVASKQRYYIEGIPEIKLQINSGQWNAIFNNITKPTQIIINYSPFNNEIFPPINNEIYIEHPWIYKPLLSIKNVKNILFDGFKFKYSSFLCPIIPKPCDGDLGLFIGNTLIPSAILIQNTKNITIKNSQLTHIGSYSIYIQNGIQTNILYNNITDIGAGGVCFTGNSNNTLISDNYIYNGGFIIRQAIGVGGGDSSNITIEYNEITQFIGNGIGIGGSNGHTPYLIVNKNHIHHNGRSDNYGISDFGAIHIGYPNNSCCAPMIINNKFHDIISVVYGGNGIYLDDGSSDIYVYGNLVYNIAGYTMVVHMQKTGAYNKKFPPIIIENNIFIVSGNGSKTCNDSLVMPISTFNRGISWSSPPPNSNNGTFINNINYIIQPNGYYFFSGRSNESWFKESLLDYNVYYSQNNIDNHDVYFPGKTKTNANMISLKQWQLDTSEDIHSKMEDPKFVNVKQCNFNLQKDSTVYKDIDFKPLNVSDVGPRY